MSTKKPSFLNILSETSRVITTHFRHFLALTILFIFPNSVVATVYSFLLQTPPSQSHLPFQIIFFLSTFLFNLCTVPCITYSAFHGFHGHPLKLIASLKSIPASFFPLLATTLVLYTIASLITFAFVFLVLIVSYTGLTLLGLEMNYGVVPYLYLFALPLVFLMMYFAVQWYLVQPTVILESKWGVAPLKRSWYLVKGMRGVIFLVMMFFAALALLLSGWLMSVVKSACGGQVSMAWIGLQVVAYVGITAMLSLYGLVAKTVVFVHCKALHEETAFQVGDKLGLVYARVPSDAV